MHSWLFGVTLGLALGQMSQHPTGIVQPAPAAGTRAGPCMAMPPAASSVVPDISGQKGVSSSIPLENAGPLGNPSQPENALFREGVRPNLQPLGVMFPETVATPAASSLIEQTAAQEPATLENNEQKQAPRGSDRLPAQSRGRANLAGLEAGQPITPLILDVPTLPGPPALPAHPCKDANAGNSSVAPLALDDVLQAVEKMFPLILASLYERTIASGEVTAAAGAFDFNLLADAISEPTGFYENNRGSAGFERRLANGGVKTFGGYRIGVGSFQPWYGERSTYDGGEFFGGVYVPLLQNRVIDKYRLNLWTAEIQRRLAEPVIQQYRIKYLQTAAKAYWKWLAAGQKVAVMRDLVRIATHRDEVFQKMIAVGEVPPIDRTDNQRVLLQRQAKLIEAERDLQQAAIELSLFWRSPSGCPQVPTIAQLPPMFPEPQPGSAQRLPDDVDVALRLRPEIRELVLQREQQGIKLQWARNQLLPTVDLYLKGSQDIGGPTKNKDKGEFELVAGVEIAVPVERRFARGQVQMAQGKISQLVAKEQYAGDNVVANVQSAVNALENDYAEFLRARDGMKLAENVEQAERRSFFLGNTSLLFVFIREQNSADARLLEIEARLGYYQSLADYRAALALDAASPAVQGNVPGELMPAVLNAGK